MISSNSQHSVLVIGSASIDLTVFASRSPQPGETIIGDSFSLVLGGKGANQAIAAAKSGAAIYFVGAVGDDDFAGAVCAGLKENSVNTAHLRQVDGATGIAHIRVDADGENNIVIIPGANSEITAAQIDAALQDAQEICDTVLIQLEIPLDAVLHSVHRAAEAGMRVILDPAPAAKLPDTIWPAIDTVTPNETEASTLTGVAVTDIESAKTAGKWFIERGVKNALITLAGAGSVLVTAEKSEIFKPFPVVAVDTTAAGDSFAGYLAGALAGGSTHQEALRTANAAGALAVTKPGASSSIPSAAEVQEFLASHA